MPTYMRGFNGFLDFFSDNLKSLFLGITKGRFAGGRDEEVGLGLYIRDD